MLNCGLQAALASQVYLNRVNERCFARIACKLESMEPCSRCSLTASASKALRRCVHSFHARKHVCFAREADRTGVTPGSVKDRIALNMINRAEQEGLISPGSTTLVRRASFCITQTTICSLWHSHDCSSSTAVVIRDKCRLLDCAVVGSRVAGSQIQGVTGLHRSKSVPYSQRDHVLDARVFDPPSRWSRRAATRAWAWRTSRRRRATSWC